MRISGWRGGKIGNMKNQRKIIFLAVIISMLIACSPTKEKVETNDMSIISIDSVVLAFYGNDGVKMNKNGSEDVFYSQLIRGNNGYFHILYESDDGVDDEILKRIGKNYWIYCERRKVKIIKSCTFANWIKKYG